MKPFILFLSVVFCQLLSFGQQQGFMLQLQHPEGYSYRTRYAVETGNGDYLLSAAIMRDALSSVEEALLLKISGDGVLLDQVSLNFQDTIVLVAELVPHPEITDQYIALGVARSSTDTYSRHLVVIQISADLEIISRHTVAIPEITRFGTYVRFIVHSEDNIVVAANYNPQSTLKQPAFYAQITTQGELKKYVRDENVNTGPLGDFFVIENRDPKRYGIFHLGADYPYESELALFELDTAFQSTLLTIFHSIIEEGEDYSYYIFNFMLGDQTVKPCPDNTFLIADQIHESWIPEMTSDQSSLLFRTGTDFVYNKNESITFGSNNDTVERPTYMQAIDFLDPNQIFFCSNTNLINSQYPCQQVPSYVQVSKLNADLEVQWTRHIGGEPTISQ